MSDSVHRSPPRASGGGGGGELTARIAAFDWASTSLGATQSWPASLSVVVGVVLRSRQAMCVLWGPEQRLLYNDAYRELLGDRDRDPEALGATAGEVWSELWDHTGPRALAALARGTGFEERRRHVVERDGTTEERHTSFSYSPILDEHGRAVGLLCSCHDDTRRLVAERRLALVRDLAATVATARTFEHACTQASAALARHPCDLPFAMLYLGEPGRGRVVLAGTAGIERGHPEVPEAVMPDRLSAWPFWTVIDNDALEVIPELAAGSGTWPRGGCDRPPSQAVAVPIPSRATGRSAVMIAGLNPCCRFDDDYREFVQLVAAQVSAALSHAHACAAAPAVAPIERPRRRALSRRDTADLVASELPLEVAGGDALGADDPGQARLMWADSTPPPGVRATLVLIDDNPAMRTYLHGLLADAHDVIVVTDPRDARAVVRDRAPDLIVADAAPATDRFELLRGLRADPVTALVPILLVSTRAGEDLRGEGLAAGADDCLAMPFGERELLARIAGLLALARFRHNAHAVMRESEARFRHLADHAPMMVWVTDAEGRCTFRSRSWYQFTGQTPETALGDGWLDAIHADDRAVAQATFGSANADRDPFRMEYRLHRADGADRWAIDAAAPRWSSDRHFLGYVGSIIDITERKEVEQRLEESDRRKDEFLATLAHELRNPLAPIRSALDVLAMGTTDRGIAARACAVMERQLRHLVRLVDDLLDVSRITRGQIELRKERVDLVSVMRSAIETTAAQIDELGHRLTVQVPTRPIHAEVDPTRIAQVLANLMQNAAMYMAPGGDLRVTLTKVDGDAVVSVRDRGVGIAPAMQASIFEMFTQLDRVHGNTHGGLGIGLTIVKRLVTMHGGTIEVRSAGLGHGSEFLVRLPTATDAAPAVAPVAAAPRRSRPPSRRVLIADDNDEAVETLAGLLGQMGHDVQVARDGVEAIEVATRFRPDVILLDLGMPRMDGLEACRRIRRLPWGGDLMIAALTGWGHADDKQRTHAAGFDRHLVKPIGRAMLEELLATCGDDRHVRDDEPS